MRTRTTVAIIVGTWIGLGGIEWAASAGWLPFTWPDRFDQVLVFAVLGVSLALVQVAVSTMQSGRSHYESMQLGRRAEREKLRQRGVVALEDTGDIALGGRR